MELEFQTYKIDENSKMWKIITSGYVNSGKSLPSNCFIIVGEDKKNGYLLVHNEDILIIGNIKITETAYSVKKEELTVIPFEYAKYDIPKKNLNLDIVEGIIKRLNE